MGTDAPLLTERGAGIVAPYAGAADHLIDLLRRVDLLLRRETLRYRRLRSEAGPPGDNDWIRFAAITDEEVDNLLLTGDRSEQEQASAAPEYVAIDTCLAQLARTQARRLEATAAAGSRLPFVDLVQLCELSPSEADVLALCLAPEIDRRYERLYGYLHDDMTRRRPSVGLTLDVCSNSPEERVAARAMFAASANLVRHQLVHVLDEAGAPHAFASRPLKLDERVLSFLAGEAGVDPRVRETVTLIPHARAAESISASGDHAVGDLLSAIEHGRQLTSAPRAHVFYVRATAGASERSVVRECGRRLSLSVVEVDCEQLAASGPGFQDGLRLVFREALLARALLHLRHVDRALEQDPGHARLRSLGRCVDAASGVIVLAGQKHWTWPALNAGRFPLPIAVERAGYGEQVETWRLALATLLALSEHELATLASLYPLTPAQVASVVTLACELAAVRGDRAVTLADIERSCREQGRPDFGQLARKVEAWAGWSDLVLPDRQVRALREICVHARFRSFVYGHWGFDRKLSLGRGISALFAGPSGTGKTMSAEVIANDLGLDLYKIDLSQVVSKYIGETEKNLHRIFQVAETGQAILFFDEADALLGKRSDVKDAHDRYANIEVAYLLQRMEEYEGITILATNLRQNIDDAFTRRIRFIIEFPFPEEEHRLRIWRGIWPTQAPLVADVDLALLARQFRLSGGNIRNAAVAAAFLASEEGDGIHMRHLLHSAKGELQKIGRLVNEEEYRDDA